MASKNGSQNDNDTDNSLLNTEVNPDVTASQFVAVDDKNESASPEETETKRAARQNAENGATAEPSQNGETETDLATAIRKGDYIAIARLRLAMEAREESEGIDFDEDGDDDDKPASTSSESSEDEFGGHFAADGDYYDSYGGHYDPWGYMAKDGSFTNTSGEHYDVKTNEFTDKSGKPIEVPGAMRQMAKADKEAGSDFLEMASMAQQRHDHGASGNPDPNAGLNKENAPVDARRASQKVGDGRQNDQPPTGKDAREVATIGAELKQEDKHHGRHAKKNWQYLPEAERLQWKLRQQYGAAAKDVMEDQQELREFIEANRNSPDAKAAGPSAKGNKSKHNHEFKAVSADEVAKTLKSQPVIHHKTAKADPAATGATGTTSAGDPKTSSSDKVETATSTTWYADKEGGFFDQYGGYYDKTGAYWDTDGTFYSADGKFTIDPKGGQHWSDGSYTDTHGHTVNKDGDYVDFDGTKVKPPAGVDFKKQMIEADQKGERWTPPEREAPLATSETRLPSSILASLPFAFAPSLTLPLLPEYGQPPLTSSSTASKDVKQTVGPVIATDAKQDASFKVDASRFTQASPQETEPSFSFSSAFSGVHDWLMGSNKTTTVKDTKFLDPSASPSTMSSPLALNSSTVTPPLTTVETKTVNAPKPGL